MTIWTELPSSVRLAELVDLLLVTGIVFVSIVWLRGSRARLAFGGVLLGGDRLVRFAIHLPLSSNHRQLGQRGTRHAAALGLAERTDALCLVVSEERGEISVAHGGYLRTLDRPELVSEEIESFIEAADPKRGTVANGGWRNATRRWREAVVAVVLTAGLWLVAVPGSGGADVDRSVPVHVYDLPEGYQLNGVSPPEVTVTLHGRHRDLLLLDHTELEARVHAYLAEQGRRTFSIEAGQISDPPAVAVVAVRPLLVKIDVTKSAPIEKDTGRADGTSR